MKLICAQWSFFIVNQQLKFFFFIRLLKPNIMPFRVCCESCCDVFINEHIGKIQCNESHLQIRKFYELQVQERFLFPNLIDILVLTGWKPIEKVLLRNCDLIAPLSRSIAGPD